MKELMRRSLAAATMVLSVSAAALADDNVKPCTVATLRGTYVFAANGYNIVAGIAQPKTIIEVIVFNGDGTLSVPAATRSVNGVIVRSLPGAGTYTVDEDCRGTIPFNGPNFDIFVAPSGQKLWLIETDSNTVFQGTATRTSRTEQGELTSETEPGRHRRISSVHPAAARHPETAGDDVR